MSRTISVNARRALDEGIASSEDQVALIRVTSPDGEDTVRLTTAAVERLSLEPLTYGVRSTWLTPSPENNPFLFILLSVQLPDDKEEGQGQVQLILDMADASMIELLRSFTGRATVDLAVVLADTPDLVEFEQQGMVLVGAQASGGQVVLSIAADPISEESFPTGRMTRERFPGLFA